MLAEILSVGTELTTGAIVDTNSAWLSLRLAEYGLAVTRHVTLPDEQAAIAVAIAEASGRASLLIVTGGIGPTADDLTRSALADALGEPLEASAAALESMRAFFAGWGRPFTETNRVQALIPRGAAPMPNLAGTAPGIAAQLGAMRIFVLPGVPAEMRRMFEESVAPVLRDAGALPPIVRAALHTFGAAEADVAGRIEHLMRPGRNPAVGTTASDAIISVRIVARAEGGRSAAELAARDEREVRALLGPLVFGRGDDRLADAVAKLLSEQQRTFSTAESCTGGLLAKCLTDVSGSSAWFLRGYVPYANEGKVEELGVQPELIAAHGAVSEQVAAAMASGCRQRSRSDYALSITGIAGPTGGTAEKPVGLVFIGLASTDGTEVKRCLFGAHLSREAIRDRACKTALNLLRLKLLESQ